MASEFQIPLNFSFLDCYREIYAWHKKHGKGEFIKWASKNPTATALTKSQAEKPYNRAYLDLRKTMPGPEKATQSDITLVLKHQARMLLEWAGNRTSEAGHNLYELAQVGLDKEYGTDFSKMDEVILNSSLSEKFHPVNWKYVYTGKTFDQLVKEAKDARNQLNF